MLALASGALTAGIFFYALQSKRPAFRLSMAFAYAGLLFLSASLVIGPWNVLRGHPNPVSTDLRRDIGIWTGLLGLAHVVVGLQVHAGGKFWLYFLYPPDPPRFLPLRHDGFGFANFTGLGATLVLTLLLGLSNNHSLRALGTKRWKALQRWNYVSFALVAVHGVAYQLIEKRSLPFVGLFGWIVLVVVTMQLVGFRKVRARMRRTGEVR
jgi:sulfoxide reductase heme-binding subunit YedZ